MMTMRYYLTCFLLLMIYVCSAQDKSLLIKKEVIEDISNDAVEVSSISYLSDGLKVNGYLLKPKKEGNYPCIIYNRGGNREFGSWNLSSVKYLLLPLAKEGYVVIASQYRGNGGSEGLEQFGGDDVNDITVLPRVLAEIEGADTSKIGMYGWSRGGMMTYLALTQMSGLKAVVVGGAVSDSHAMIKDRQEMDKYVYAELVPNYAQNKEEELDKRSAVQWVESFPKDVPILVLHGAADWHVKPEHSLRMALEFDKYRIPYRLIMFEGDNHGIRQHRDEVNQQAINWLDRFLKEDEVAPDMEFKTK